MHNDLTGLIQVLSQALEASSNITNQAEYLNTHGVSLDKKYAEIPFELKKEIETIEQIVKVIDTKYIKGRTEIDVPNEVYILILSLSSMLFKFKSCWKK